MSLETRRRIVVVDDDLSVRLTVQRQLDVLGWDAVVAASAAEALTMLAGMQAVDALLTDINMPGMDGVALQREVDARFPGVPVLLMSGAADALALAPNPTASIVLRKPFSLQALADAIAAMDVKGR